MNAAPGMQGEKNKDQKEFPDTNVIYPYDTSEVSSAHVNNITKEYVNYVEKLDSSLLDGIS